MATLSSIITPTNITTATNTQTLTNKTLSAPTITGSSSFTTSAPTVPGGFEFRNRITNGAMRIDQRNAGALVTPTTSGAWSVDRWSVAPTQNSKLTIQRNAGSVTPPTGFSNYLGITSSTAYSILSTDYFFISHVIEGCDLQDIAWGTANAKTVTLSFVVYSSLTGTFGGAVRNAGTGGFRSYPFSYTISSANTWTTVSVTITGDTSGTWSSSAGAAGIYLIFGIGVGSTYSTTAGSWAGGNYLAPTGATSVVGTNGAKLYITGVQLEVGSAATPYEQIPYQVELARCQRYYATSIESGATITNFATLNATGVGGVMAIANATNNDLFPNVRYPVPMATNPTLTVYSGANRTAGSVRNMINGTDIAGFSNGSATSNNMGFGYIAGNTLFAGTVYGFHYTADTGL
jgi:hypothetical protein